MYATGCNPTSSAKHQYSISRASGPPPPPPLLCARRQHELLRSACRIGTDVIILSMTVRDLRIYVDAAFSIRSHVDTFTVQQTHSLLFRLASSSTAQYPTSICSNVCIPESLSPYQRCTGADQYTPASAEY